MYEKLKHKLSYFQTSWFSNSISSTSTVFTLSYSMLLKAELTYLQTAGALTFLKRVGIIHSDLKPDNIMLIDHLAQPLRIKVIDFGIAGFVSRATQHAMIQPLCYRYTSCFCQRH